MSHYMQSPVGWLALEEQDDFITGINFMDDPPESWSETVPPPILQEAAAQLEAYFNGLLKEFPILQYCNQPGTAFQQRVWRGLVEIPFGKTASYRQMAIRLGDEKCIRAAASANGQNNLAIVVPCHRVIGSNGSLTGYAGGLWRKKWLLEHEARLGGGAVQASLGF